MHMKIDFRYTTIRDRCRNLSAGLRAGRSPTGGEIAQIAEDLASVADALNALLNQWEQNASKRQPDKPEPFGKF